MGHGAHRLLFRLLAFDDGPALTINDRPVAGVRRWALVDEGTYCRLEVECYKLDPVGQRMPKRDAAGQVIRPMQIRVGADGMPLLGADGQPHLVEGEPAWEVVTLRGTLRREGTIELAGELPLSGPNLELCEGLISRSVEPPPPDADTGDHGWAP